MSSITKVFLLFAAVMFCISEAQNNEKGQSCLCDKTRDRLGPRKQVKNIQIYRESPFCDRVEIVVTNKNDRRFCLNPNLEEVQKLMASMMSKKRSRTTATTPTSGSVAQ